ncbi:PC4/YdbC family ssDNA-binding protein [Sandarakinorhabdus glacialis]|uniref:PC4/YdbC family ssDNA-binding protein n=1 Tax=Sandarakinorhabdus glacialis TaxID=1614636 RepID=UPI00166E67F0|nr:PC4/YdbC family ssDNA-binding protein [Polymorphobacter glacialis]
MVGSPAAEANEPISVLLFEQPHRGDVWRLEVAHHGGRAFLNWRKWWLSDGILKPTRQGVTMPLGRLADLYEAIGSYLEPDGPGQRY